MNCPKCRKEPMNQETWAGIEIDRCPVCRGLYLDRGELERLLAAEQGNLADSLGFTAVSDVMDGRAAHCFRCDQPMAPYLGPAELRFEWCGACGGVFLDQGELATLQLHTHEI